MAIHQSLQATCHRQLHGNGGDAQAVKPLENQDPRIQNRGVDQTLTALREHPHMWPPPGAFASLGVREMNTMNYTVCSK